MMTSTEEAPTAEIQVLLKQYAASLQLSLTITQRLAALLQPPALPPIEDRLYVIGGETAAQVLQRQSAQFLAALGAPPPTFTSVVTPIQEQRPNAIRQYNQSTDPVVGTGRPFIFGGLPLWVVIDNVNTGNSISISFDNQRTYKKIPKNSSLAFALWSWPANLNTFYYKSVDAASVAFEILSGEL